MSFLDQNCELFCLFFSKWIFIFQKLNAKFENFPYFCYCLRICLCTGMIFVTMDEKCVCDHIHKCNEIMYKTTFVDAMLLSSCT